MCTIFVVYIYTFVKSILQLSVHKRVHLIVNILAYAIEQSLIFFLYLSFYLSKLAKQSTLLWASDIQQITLHKFLLIKKA